MSLKLARCEHGVHMDTGATSRPNLSLKFYLTLHGPNLNAVTRIPPFLFVATAQLFIDTVCTAPFE